MQQRSLFDSKRHLPETQTATSAVPESQKIFSVSEVTAQIKFLLETNFTSIWVEGEISNFSQSPNGHFYFSLKDERSQIRVVMWKSSHRYLRWRPKNGMKVMAHGRLLVYEPRGDYQIEVVQLVPHGKGDLFAAFEQLKEKLQAEGLFDPKRKRPIPMLPKKIGIVTSSTGAVIRDILQILSRRYLNLHILIYPAKVQGDEAAPTIVEGIRALNRFKDIDVLIVARGGGSIEDLWPFNEESVARSIAASRIPVISAVGHETDTTIADFVADLRAPTPSAAAELVIGKKSEFIERLANLSQRMHAVCRTRFLDWKHTVNLLSQHRALAGIPQKIHNYQQMLDECEIRLYSGPNRYYQIQSRRLLQLQQQLSPAQLRHLIEVKRSMLNNLFRKMQTYLQMRIGDGHKKLARYAGKLDSLSPLAVLERGYSITSNEGGALLKDSAQVTPGERVRIRLHRGKLKCEVKEVENE